MANARQRQVRSVLRSEGGHPWRYRPVFGLVVLAVGFAADILLAAHAKVFCPAIIGIQLWAIYGPR